jgi:hypothetical protein
LESHVANRPASASPPVTPPPETPADTGDETSANEKIASFAFKISVLGSFLWCILGLIVIYGVRVYFNSPIHPSFVPFIGVTFGVIVAFAIVLTLKYTNGDIEFKLFGNELRGASGPIVLWVVCFLAIVYGLYLLGITEVVKTQAPSSSGPLHEIWYDSKSKVSPTK